MKLKNSDTDTLKRTSYEEILEKKGYFVFTNVGCSMLPLLRQKRDLMVICALPKPDGKHNRAQKYDVVLFKYQGKYVLHRVLSVHDNGTYTICGDNCIHCERDVKDSQLMGVLTEVQRDGKTIYVDMNKERRAEKIPPFTYRLFVHLLCDAPVFRPITLRGRSYVAALKRKLRRLRQKA